MGPFILDLVLGIFFILSISVSIIGFLAFRNRREAGPLLLASSGLMGSISSVLYVLDRSGAMELPSWVLLILSLLTVFLLLSSILLWRYRK